jgi:uncharacterized membrane protein
MNKIKTLTLASLTLLGSNFVVMDASAAVAKEKCYGVVYFIFLKNNLTIIF